MTTVRVKFGKHTALITHQDDWEVGGQPPANSSDYLGWHAWAELQHKAGLRQKQCGKCGLWKYPQELSGKFSESIVYKDARMTKPVRIIEPICNKCAVTPGLIAGEG